MMYIKKFYYFSFLYYLYSSFINLYYLFIDLFYYSKYFLYFNFFFFSLFINSFYFFLFNNYNKYCLNLLYFTINLNGCILIKLIQWLNNNITLLQINQNNNNIKIYLSNLFHNFYENCNIHNIKHTKKLFKNDFNLNFDDVFELDLSFSIKSGSMAQVYKAKFKNNNFNIFNNYNNFHNLKDFDINNFIAIKVIHPEIKYQMIFPFIVIKIYKFITYNIKLFYHIIFTFDSFFINLKKQFSMSNEYNNINYFYNYYKNNEYIIIPKPIIYSQNILIMEFIEASDFEMLNDNYITKQKIILLLILFMKDNFMFLDKYHSDLHNGNWKIIKYNNFYKLVIYDFGYIIENNNYMQNFYKEITYLFDTNDYEKLSIYLYNFILNKNDFKIDLEFFKSQFLNYIIINKIKYKDISLLIYNFFYYNNYNLGENIFELFLSLILIKKNYVTYILSQYNVYDFNSSMNLNLIYYTLCKTLNIFHNLQSYFLEYYINNNNVLMKFKYSNSNFDFINSHSNNNNNNNNNNIIIDI